MRKAHPRATHSSLILSVLLQHTHAFYLNISGKGCEVLKDEGCDFMADVVILLEFCHFG